MFTSAPAPLRLRCAAAIYDLFPLAGLWMLSAAVALLVAHGEVDVAHPSLIYRSALQVALLAVTSAYFVLSWTRGGQTIGMRAWRLRIIAVDGGAMSWPRALLRFVIALFSLLACGLGFLWCLIDRNRRTWHDLAARSAMVLIEHRGPIDQVAAAGPATDAASPKRPMRSRPFPRSHQDPE